MRIDPDAIYIELDGAATIVSLSSRATRTAPAVILHWKDGRRWTRRSLIADPGETLGDVLRNLGGAIDEHGLDELLAKAVAR